MLVSPVHTLARTHTHAACRGFDGQLLLGVLPVAQFSSGHTYFVQRLGERLGLPQYAVHATFQFSGTPGKRTRMRERLLWTAVSPTSDHVGRWRHGWVAAAGRGPGQPVAGQ